MEDMTTKIKGQITEDIRTIEDTGTIEGTRITVDTKTKEITTTIAAIKTTETIKRKTNQKAHSRPKTSLHYEKVIN